MQQSRFRNSNVSMLHWHSINDYYRVLRVAVNDDLTTTTVEDVGILHLNSRNQRYELLKIMVNDGSHAASSVAYEIAKGNYFSYTEAVKWGHVDAAPPISIVPTN